MIMQMKWCRCNRFLDFQVSGQASGEASVKNIIAKVWKMGPITTLYLDVTHLWCYCANAVLRPSYS